MTPHPYVLRKEEKRSLQWNLQEVPWDSASVMKYKHSSREKLFLLGLYFTSSTYSVMSP